MKRSIREVTNIITRMKHEVRRGVPRENVEKKFADFKSTHPRLYAMILENGNYDDELDAFLEAARTVEAGGVTQDEMDKTIGYKMAQKYVYPKLDMRKEQEYVAAQMVETEALEKKLDKLWSDDPVEDEC